MDCFQQHHDIKHDFQRPQGKGKAEPKLDEAQLAELRAQQQIHARAELARRMDEEASISKVANQRSQARIKALRFCVRFPSSSVPFLS